MGTKGVGPRGLGVSPLKQTRKKQSIMQNEDGSEYTKEQAATEHRQSLLDSIQDVSAESLRQGAAVGSGLIGGGGRVFANLATRIAGGLAKNQRTANLANKILNFSNKGSSTNQKALNAFKNASPKDPTKTTRLSSYNK